MCFCIFFTWPCKAFNNTPTKKFTWFHSVTKWESKNKRFCTHINWRTIFPSFPDESLLLIMHKPIHVWIKSQCLSHTGAQHHLPGGFLSPKSSSNDATSMGLSPRLPPRNPKLRSKTRSASCEADLTVQNLARNRKCTKRQPFVRSHHGRTF